MKSEWEEVKVQDILYTTDYVANGSFAALKENVTYRDSPDYAVLIRLVDYNRSWNGGFKYVDEDSYEFLKKSSLEPKDVIISNVGANLGTVFQAPELSLPMTLGPNAILLKPDRDDVDRDYIYYFFMSRIGQGEISGIVSGSAQPKFNKTHFRAIKLSLPPLATQKTIAHILSTLDDKIELNRKMNETLESMAQAIFKSWFVDFDPVHAKAGASSEDELDKAAKDLGISREVLDLFPSEFEESELGLIPKGWEPQALGDICSVITKGTTPKKADLEGATDTAVIPFIKVKDITSEGEIKRDSLEKVPSSVHLGAIKRSILKQDDLLFSIAGTIGRVAVVDSDLDNSNTNQAVGIIRLRNKVHHLSLIWLALQSNLTQMNIASKVVQAVQANTSLTNLRDIPVLLPTTVLLNRWNDVVEGLLDKLRANRIESRSLVETRDTLLPKLLSGELDVSNLNLGLTDD